MESLARHVRGRWSRFCALFLHSAGFGGLLVGFAIALGSCEEDDSARNTRLSIYLMARCPFAVDLVRELLPVLDRLDERVDLELNFIARREGDKLSSMYGEEDLAQGRLQVCAFDRHGPLGWRRLMKCQFAYGADDQTAWAPCADAAGLDVSALTACAEGPEGQKLFAASVERSRAAGYDGSPTLLLDGKLYEKGRVAPILGRDLCAAIRGTKPRYCAELPKPTPVEITIVVDNRCKLPTCETSRFLRYVETSIAGAAIHTVDFARPEAKAMYRQSGASALPIAVFSRTIEAEQRAFSKLREAGLSPLPGGDGFVLPLGADFRPDAT